MKFPGEESNVLEFKRTLPRSGQIVNTMIAFCNTYGGRLVIGVDDTGEIFGVAEEHINQLMDQLHQSIYQSCSPTLLPQIYTQRIAEKLILIIEVSAGMNKPYFKTAEGINEGTYIRVGAHTFKADAMFIQGLQWQAQGFAADEIPVYLASMQDIEYPQFQSFLSARQFAFKKDQLETVLANYKISISEHHNVYPTTAGILLFGRCPQRFFSEAFIICSHFKGTTGRDVLATRDCTGPLFKQLAESMEFLQQQLNREFTIQETQRSERLEIPEEALREVLINAIVHRNYQVPGPIKVAIYANRVEVFSPGSFPGPLSVDQLEMGLTYIRNEVICRVFREAGYIEKLGSGFLTVFSSYRQRRLPTPQVIAEGNFVKCILPRNHAAKVSVQRTDEACEIEKMFMIVGEIKARDVMRHLNVSRQTASRLLSKLVAKGILRKVGKGPATSYRKYTAN